MAELHEELDMRTDVLIALMDTRSSYSELEKGVDAAGCEFDAPPEVFAPSYHRLREDGLLHFTYHAGEEY